MVSKDVTVFIPAPVLVELLQVLIVQYRRTIPETQKDMAFWLAFPSVQILNTIENNETLTVLDSACLLMQIYKSDPVNKNKLKRGLGSVDAWIISIGREKGIPVFATKDLAWTAVKNVMLYM